MFISLKYILMYGKDNLFTFIFLTLSIYSALITHHYHKVNGCPTHYPLPSGLSPSPVASVAHIPPAAVLQ